MGVIKNLWVRIGGDATGAVKSFKSASSAGNSAKESIKRSSAETKRSIRDMFTSAAPSIKEYTATVSRTKEAHQTAVQNISRLSDQIAQMEDVYNTVKNATDGLNLSKSLGDQIAETEKQLETINVKLHKTQEAINRIGSSKSARKQERLEALQEELRDLIAESDETSEHLRALDQAAERVGSDNMGYASAEGLEKLKQKILATENELRTTQAVADETKSKLQSMGVGVSAWFLIKKEAKNVKAAFFEIGNAFQDVVQKDPSTGIADRLVRLGRSMKQIPANILHGVANGFNRIAATIRAIPQIPGKILTGLKNIGKSAAQAAGTGVKKLGTGLKNLAGSAARGIASLPGKLRDIGKSASAGCGGLTKMVRSIRNIGIASLGMRVASGMFGRLRSVISSYISQNEELNASVTEMKNQMGAALAPAMEIVLAALQKLMPLVTAVFNAISSVFTTLFGKVSATGKAIKAEAAAAGEAAEGMGVLGFDQITKEEDNSQEDDSKKTAGKIAEQSALVKKLTAWIQKLKAAFAAGDWMKLGQIIGDSINNIVNAFDGTGAGEKIGKFVNNVVTALHGLLTSIDFFKIGAKLGDMLTSSMKQVNWGTVGETIGAAWTALPSALVGFILKTDWAVVAKSLSTAIKSLLGKVTQWVKSVDWLQIGRSIATFIGNVDWGGIAKNLFEYLGSALAAAVSVLWGFIEDAVTSIGDYFGEKIKDAGGNVAKGLWNGIVEGLGNIGRWIVENIFDPFIKGFCDVFQIHSPAKAVSDKSKFISEGLLSGIMSVDVFGRIKTWFKDNVLKPLTDGFSSVAESVAGVFSNIWDKVKGWINKLIGGVESMVNGIISGVNWLIDKFNSLAEVGKSVGVDLTISKISTINLPRLAKGAVVDQPTAAVIGEAGKEVVMPLENNTGWISKLAQQINQQNGGSTNSLTLAIYFRTRKLAEYVIKDINQITQETGVCPIYV